MSGHHRHHNGIGDIAIKLTIADQRADERGQDPSLAFETGTEGLEQLLYEIDTDQRLSVLDLGHPNQAVVDLFYGMRVRLHMGDLLRGLEWDLSSPESVPPISDERIEACLNHVHGQRFDAILAWDLFNYFSPSELTCVMKHLRQLCHSGTLLHCVMFVSDKKPQLPSNLTPTRRRRLRYEPQTDILTPVDPSLRKSLIDCLPGFDMTEETKLGSILVEQLRRFKASRTHVA